MFLAVGGDFAKEYAEQLTEGVSSDSLRSSNERLRRKTARFHP